MKPNLTAARLRELLRYDPETGVFTWRVRTTNRIKAGDAAGNVTAQGYRGIGIDGVPYLAHRLAVLYMTGEWPVGEEVDHRDGDRLNNRWLNLRDGTRSFNQQNQRRARAGTVVGLLGVSLHKCGKFVSAIKVGGKQTHLGLHDTAEQAHAAYVAAKRELHPGGTL